MLAVLQESRNREGALQVLLRLLPEAPARRSPQLHLRLLQAEPGKANQAEPSDRALENAEVLITRSL